MRDRIPACLFSILLLVGCQGMNSTGDNGTLHTVDTLAARDGRALDSVRVDSFTAVNTRTDAQPLPATQVVDTRDVHPEQVVKFAQTLEGTPYVYGSTNPEVGFDCSGFITYVFNRFDISVPRSSIDFTNVGTEVPVQEARRGDLILFTGTNPAERFVGHMGIVVTNTDTLRFIHSTSGKAMSVTTTALTDHYKERFVKVIRVFRQNNKH